MSAVFFDPAMTDDERRAALFQGDYFINSPAEQAVKFCEFTQSLVEEAFAGMDPEHAQQQMNVGEYAAMLSELKPRFIHHPRSKEFVRDVLAERGCDLEQTYFDVPRLRTATSDGYLTSGIAYAWHPHRDTWYSAPMAQLNFWMPVYEIEAGNAMAMHTTYFDQVVPNSSDVYNYYEWNAVYRPAASANVTTESRPLPAPTVQLDLPAPVIFVAPVGGMLEFSGQHLHSSVPNRTGKTRFSIDFRTVHIGDIRDGRGAPNVDAKCTGSAIRDFMRASDFAPMPQDVVDLFNDGTESRGDLVFVSQ